MKRVKFALIAAVITIFITPLLFIESSYGKIETNNQTTIEEQLGKIEQDLKSGVPNNKIVAEIKQIRKLKKNSPIFYIPEINYLLDKKIENIPPSSMEKLRERIFQLDILISGATLALALIGSFSLIYLADKLFSSEFKRNFSILLGAILILFALCFKGYPFYAIFSLLAGVSFISKKKIPFSFLMFVLIILHIAGVSLTESYFRSLSSEKNITISKLQRDNYAPYFLFSSLPPTEREIANLSNKQALLYPIPINEWENILKKNIPPEFKAIVINNIGCYLFANNKVKEALSFFENAEKLYPAPKIKYNLFLTYTSLLQPKKAEYYAEQLKEYNHFFDKQVPLSANLGDIRTVKTSISIPYGKIAIVVICFLISVISVSKLFKKHSLISINPIFSRLPGYNFYYKNNYPGIIILSFSSFLTVYIVRLLCLANL